MATDRPGILDPHLPDDVTVRHWLAVYAVFFAALAIPLAVLAGRQGWSWSQWTADPGAALAATDATVKLLVLCLYVSLCCTFLPLPTGWLIAAAATREAAVAAGASDSVVVVALLTTALVGVVGAVGSTMANLNDYHIFTWMLRHRRIAAVRKTRTYQSAARWFARSPFFLILLFNIIPIPVDFVRMLATTHRYPRVPFALANFLGRLVRYGTIAFVTYWWDLGRIAPIALLVIAMVLGAGRVAPKIFSRAAGRRANQAAAGVSSSGEDQQEQDQ